MDQKNKSRKRTGKTYSLILFLALLLSLNKHAAPLTIPYNLITMPHRRFRVVASIQNTKDIIIAGGSISSNPTYLEVYQFDATDSTVSGIPGKKSFKLIAGTGSDPETIFNQAANIEPQYIEGYPTQPPYKTQILGEYLPNPNTILSKEEIYNLLPKKAIPNTEILELKKEFFPPNPLMVLSGNCFMSLNFTADEFDPSKKFLKFSSSEGNINYMHPISFTNRVTFSIFEDLDIKTPKLDPLVYILGIYDFYDGIIRKFQMAWMGEFSFNKFGSNWIMSLSIKWNGSDYDISREVFDSTQPTGSSRILAFQKNNEVTITRMIGTVIRGNDILAQLKPNGSSEYTKYYFTMDNARTLVKYDFTSISHAKINERQYPSTVFVGTPKHYKSIYDTDYVLITFNFGYVILVNIESSSLFYYFPIFQWYLDGYESFENTRNLALSTHTKYYTLSSFLSSDSSYDKSEIIVHPYNSDKFPCGLGCDTCKNSDTSIFGCVTCKVGRTKLDDGRCVCPEGQYDDGSDCLACDSLCKSGCFNSGAGSCIQCQEGYGKNAEGLCVIEQSRNILFAQKSKYISYDGYFSIQSDQNIRQSYPDMFETTGLSMNSYFGLRIASIYSNEEIIYIKEESGEFITSEESSTFERYDNLDSQDYEITYDDFFTISFKILNLTKYKTVKSFQVVEIEDHFPAENPVKIAYERDLIFQKYPLVAKAPKFVETFNNTVISTTVIALGVSTSAMSFALTGAGNGGIMSLVKLFQILDVLSNLSKVNVDHGDGIQSIFDFIDSISFPRIPFVEQISPVDENDYIFHNRNTRRQLVRSNIDTFIFADSIFVLAIAILLLKCISFILEKKRILKRMNKIVSWAYFLTFNIAYYDLQIIIFTELTQSKIISKKNGKLTFHIALSYLASFIIGLLMVFEILRINSIFQRKRAEFKRSHQHSKLETLILKTPKNISVGYKVVEYIKDGLSYSDSLLVTKFTEDISPCYILIFRGSQFRFQIINFSRILIMMFLIASMQMMANGQIITILVIQITYMVYMFMTIFKKECIREQIYNLNKNEGSYRISFNSNSDDKKSKDKFKMRFMNGIIVKFKYIVLEVCTVMIILTMLVFSLTEKSKFRETIYYLRLEKLVMWLLILAIFSELFFFMYQISSGIITSYKQRKIKQYKLKTQSKKIKKIKKPQKPHKYFRITKKRVSPKFVSKMLSNSTRKLIPGSQRSPGESRDLQKSLAISRLHHIAAGLKLGKKSSENIIRKKIKSKVRNYQYNKKKNQILSSGRSQFSSDDRISLRPRTALRLTSSPITDKALSITQSYLIKKRKEREKTQKQTLGLFRDDSFRSIQTSRTVKKIPRTSSQMLKNGKMNSPSLSSSSRIRPRRLKMSSKFRAPTSNFSEACNNIFTSKLPSPTNSSEVGSIVIASPSKFKRAILMGKKNRKAKEVDHHLEKNSLSYNSPLSHHSSDGDFKIQQYQGINHTSGFQQYILKR